MRPADLDDFHKLVALLLQEGCQSLDSRKQYIRNRHSGCDVHGRRECVVGGLRLVNVIIGMHRGFATESSSSQFYSTIGYHFVEVHIRMSATAGLPDLKRKLIVKFALDDLFGSLYN